VIPISPEALTQYQSILTERSVPDGLHNYYKKWLRYYLDFCAKYSHPVVSEGSIQLFLDKLREKNQTAEQRKQASHALSLYLDLLARQTGSDDMVEPSAGLSSKPGSAPVSMALLPKTGVGADRLPETGTPPSPKEPEGRALDASTPCLAGWGKVHADLSGEIRVRHYSPKTLKSYALWAKKFEKFTCGKDPESLTPADVREFMKHLAITEGVSASGQL
jgi:hypothetical protein